MRKNVVFAVIGVAILLVAAVAVAILIQPNMQTMVLATTTSTQDSGLLDFILPDFESKYNVEVYVIAVGTGQALEYGKRGDADVLLVHDPDKEKKFVADGYGESRTLVAYNQFIIIGPEDDPAGIAEASNASDAFRRIHDSGTEGEAKFVTRGDLSGTHSKEKKLWSLAGLNMSTFESSWYINASNGMGDTLLMCEELEGYTLSDQATFFTYDGQNHLPHMDLLYQGDTALFNQYSVIPVNSTLWPNVNRTLALNFVDWITSSEVQSMIGNYSISGNVLFTPNAGPGAAKMQEVQQLDYLRAAPVTRLAPL